MSVIPEPSSPASEVPLRVAIVIPILNEAKTLPSVLASIADQDYPLTALEILIVDGGSTDDWHAAIDAVELPGATVRRLHNPRRVTPAAVNLALAETDAPTVLWISGHCTLANNYVSEVVGEFNRHDNVAVGGRLLVEGTGFAGSLNAMVLRSPIGTGLAPWRWSTKRGWVSAVNFALFDRHTLIDMGGLDERLTRNQDNDLVRRLRDRGVRFYQVESTVRYIAPRTLRGLWTRAWGNASWIIWCWKLGVPSARWYHIAPMTAGLIAVALTVGSIFSASALNILLGLLIAYAVVVIGHTLIVTIPSGQVWAIPVLPLHLFMFHAIYGLGGWSAVIRPVPQNALGAAGSSSTNTST